MDVGYFRRCYGNFPVTDNRAVAAVRLQPVQHHGAGRSAAAGWRRLHGRTGSTNLNPNKVGQVDNFVTLRRQLRQADRALERRGRHGERAAPQRGILLQGGVSTGRTSTDNCDVAGQACPKAQPVTLERRLLPRGHDLPDAGQAPRHLHGAEGRRAGLAATFQSLPGPQVTANYVASNALIQPSLGRPLSGGAANVDGQHRAAGHDVRRAAEPARPALREDLPFGRTRTAINFDLYNVAEREPGAVAEQQLRGLAGAASILDARLFKISVQFDF